MTFEGPFYLRLFYDSLPAFALAAWEKGSAPLPLRDTGLKAGASCPEGAGAWGGGDVQLVQPFEHTSGKQARRLCRGCTSWF